MSIITQAKLQEKREKFKTMIDENFKSVFATKMEIFIVQAIKRIVLHVAMQCYLEGIGDVYAEQIRTNKKEQERRAK